MAKRTMPNDNFIGIVVGEKVELNSAWRTYLAAIEQLTTPEDAQPEDLNGEVGVVVNQEYVLIQKASYERTINNTITDCVSGTCTATFAIDGTPLGGTANAVSSTEQNQAHTTANVLPIGGTLSMTLSANSSCLRMRFTVDMERTAA